MFSRFNFLNPIICFRLPSVFLYLLQGFLILKAQVAAVILGSSSLSVGSTRSQDGEAAWRFLAPHRIDHWLRQQLLRWS